MISKVSKHRYFSILKLGFFAATAAIVLGGCMATAPERTSLEIQAFQMQEFETTKQISFNSTVSVFQDLGYIIEAASFETGIITAASPVESSVMLFTMAQTNTRATAFVEQRRPDVTTVRLNFVETQRRSGGYGQQSGRDTPIHDPEVYQNAFSRISDAIFIRAGT